MQIYEEDDEVTLYFVIHKTGDREIIRGWSDNKALVKAYMKFHNCKKFHLKAVTSIFRDMMEVINENNHDEIALCNITIRNPKHKKGHESKMIVAPLTETERLLVNDECKAFMASSIDYHYAQSAFYYLRNKYQNALKGIFFEDVMNYVIHQKRSAFVESTKMDELSVLFRSLTDCFG